MSRIIFTILCLLLIPLAAALGFLRSEGVWDQHRKLDQAVTDMVFFWDVQNTEVKGRQPPPLTRESYLKVRERFIASKPQIREQAYLRMEAWGADVIPFLMEDLQNPPHWRYIKGLSKVLADLQYAKAGPLMLRHLYTYHNQDAIHDAIFDAIAALGVRGSDEELIAWQARRVGRNGQAPVLTRHFLIAVAKTGGKDYLLQQLRQAYTTDQIVKLIEPLAYTYDPKVVKLIMDYANDEREPIAIAATKALDHIVAPMAISALTDQFLVNENPFIRRSIIENHFDDNDIFYDSRILPLLASLLQDPLYKKNAAYALLNNETRETVSALAPLSQWDNLDRLFIDLDFYNRKNQKYLLLKLLDHPNPRIRIQAIDQLWFNPDHDVGEKLIETMQDDDLSVHDKAVWASRTQAKVRLYYDLLAPLIDDPESLKQLADRKFFKLVTWPQQHPAMGFFILVLMLFFGFVLVFDLTHIFNRYRANAFLHVLLLTGLLSNFWTFSAYQHYYVYSNGVWLLLLLGYLFAQQSIDKPKDAASRFGLFGGARVWLFTPALLILLSPLLSDALEHILIQPRWFKICLQMWLVSVVLLLFDFIFAAAPALLKRSLDLLMSSALLISLWALLAMHIWLSFETQANRQVFGFWLLLPLILVLFGLWLLRLFHLFKRTRILALFPPSDRFYLSSSMQEPVTVVERSYKDLTFKQRVSNLLVLSIPLLVAAGLSLIVLLPAYFYLQATGLLSGYIGVFIIMHLLVTLLLGWELVVLQPLYSAMHIQLAQGYIRSGYVLLGFAFSGAYWRSRLRTEIELSADEQAWIKQLSLDLAQEEEVMEW